jgi:hypothetical protein
MQVVTAEALTPTPRCVTVTGMTTQAEAQATDPWRPQDTLGARLVLVRRQLGLSQRAAAETAGIGFGSWQSMEDDRSPRDLLQKVQRICVAFGVDRDWLLWGGPLGEGAGPTTSGWSADSRDYDPALMRSAA